MPNITPNFSWNLPLVNNATDADLWGGYLNANWSDLDTVLATYAPLSGNNDWTGDNDFQSNFTIGSSVNITSILDEDNMASDSATALATQQSIKAYVDNNTSATGYVLQTFQNQKTDTATLATTTWTATGLSQAITPANSGNKVLIRVMIMAGGATGIPNFRIKRDSTVIGVGDVAGSRTPVSAAAFGAGSNAANMVFIEWLDTPNTTSSTTYSIEWRSYDGATVYLNRTGPDTDNSTFYRGVSTLTVQEIKG